MNQTAKPKTVVYNAPERIDLSDMESLGQSKDVTVVSFNQDVVREHHAGAIGRRAIGAVVLLLLLLPLTGGLIAAFGSVAQAQAFTTTVVALLEAVGRFVMTAFWPIMVYYFLRQTVKKSD